MFYNREAQTGSACSAAPARISPIKSPCKMWEMFRIDTITPVSNRQPCIGILAALQDYADGFVLVAILQRVIDQIAYKLFKLLLIAANVQVWCKLKLESFGPVLTGDPLTTAAAHWATRKDRSI